MSLPNFVQFNDLVSNAVIQINVDATEVAELSPVPATNLPPGVTDGTWVRFSSGLQIGVRGTVAATTTAMTTGAIKTVSTLTYVLSDADDGKMLVCTNAGGCTITVPQGLTPGMSCNIQQAAATQVTVAAGAGETLQVSVSHSAPYKTADQYSVLGITALTATVASVYGALA